MKYVLRFLPFHRIFLEISAHINVRRCEFAVNENFFFCKIWSCGDRILCKLFMRLICLPACHFPYGNSWPLSDLFPDSTYIVLYQRRHVPSDSDSTWNSGRSYHSGNNELPTSPTFRLYLTQNVPVSHEDANSSLMLTNGGANSFSMSTVVVS